MVVEGKIIEFSDAQTFKRYTTNGAVGIPKFVPDAQTECLLEFIIFSKEILLLPVLYPMLSLRLILH